MLTYNQKVRIYAGGPLENQSERLFLQSIIAHFERLGIPAIILANFHLAGRQLDFVVATAKAIALVEVKSSHLPIRGELNGDWTRLSASGEWTTYPNAYEQALAAKNRVRDTMSAFGRIGSFYPAGFVVWARPLPAGSQIPTGDFKVRIVDVDGFISELGRLTENPLTLSECQRLAVSLSLKPTTAEAAIDEAGSWARLQKLDAYRAAFLNEYQEEGTQWLPENAGQEIAISAAARANVGCYIVGPSGCGKTILSKKIASAITREGGICAFFAAKEFGGSWSETIRREMSLLVDQNERDLIRSFTRSDVPAYFIFDGTNELPSDRARRAIRGLRALARQYNARLIVTSQYARPPELDGLEVISIDKPSAELKQRIAQRGTSALRAAAVQVLRGVASGFEARIVGEIGDDLQSEITRVALIDQYIRARLGDRSRAGAFGLRRLAWILHEQVAFSISETAFDEFMRIQGVGFSDCDALFQAEILTRRRGRISFRHEMFLNACAAHELAKVAKANPTGFGWKLNLPRLEPIAGDVISLLESASECRAVLEQIKNASVILEAADGGLGKIPAAVVISMLAHTQHALLKDIQTSSLRIVESDGNNRLVWENNRDWSAEKGAQLAVIGRLARRGKGVAQYFALCRAMDERLLEERRRLMEVAREKGFALKSASFALAYYGHFDRHGFTTVVRSWQADDSEASSIDLSKSSFDTMTSGQLLFVLESRYSLFDRGDSEWLAGQILKVLKERWALEPYHVHLAILEAVGFLRDVSEAVRSQIIEALNALDVSPSNWAINSSIIDALKMLGALDDEAEGEREGIRDEIASVLNAEPIEQTFDRALSLYTRMFDHPFDYIYCDEIYALTDDNRRRLYRLAFQSGRLSESMSLRWLAEEIAEYEDNNDGKLFERFSGLPSQTNPFAQDEMAAFAISVRVLARHGMPLPTASPSNDVERCMAAMRTLVYCAEAGDTSGAEVARLAWEDLYQLSPHLVVGCFSEIFYVLMERHHGERARAFQPLNLMEIYSGKILTICRKFISGSKPPESYHQIPHVDRAVSMAFQIIGSYGDRADLDSLRSITRGHTFVRDAILAIQSIETTEQRNASTM